MRLSKLIEGRTYTYEMILRKQDLSAIGYIPYSSISYTRKFNDYDELSFTTFRYLYSQKDKAQYINPIWENLTAGYVVELRIWDSNFDEDSGVNNSSVSGVKKCVYREYFTVSKPDMQANETSDSEKNINCIAQHQMTFKKLKLRGFDDTRKLFDCELSASTTASGEIEYTVVTDANGYPIESTYTVDGEISTYDPANNVKGGILNYILKYILPDWTVTYYDSNLLKIGQQGRQINVDRDLFTGSIIITGDDSDGHGILQQGIATYWTTTGRAIYDDMRTAITSSEITSYSLYSAVDGTAKLQYQINNIWNKYAISSFLSSDNVWNENNINAIINEPLNGAKLLADSESLLVATQTLINDLYNFQYNSDMLRTVDDKKIDVLSQAKAFVYINEYCNALLYKLIYPLYIYKTASGNVPYRSLQLDGTMVDVFEKLQDSFLCVFEFDNINKTIQIYSRDNEVVNPDSSLVISPDNFMTDISYQADTDQITTRVYATGKDDLWISGANITGQRFVDNFGYFTSQPNKYFSADSNGNYPLVDALETYEQVIEYYSDKANQVITRSDLLRVSGNKYENITETYNLEQLRNRIAELSDRVAVCQSLAKQWVHVYYSDSKSSGATQDVSVGAVIAANNELSEIEQDISQYIDFKLTATTVRAIYDIENDTYNTGSSVSTDTPIGAASGFYLYINLYRLQDALVNWQKQFTYENVKDFSGNKIFTDEMLNQLRAYIYEEDISFENISDDNVLYQYSKDYLEYINQIPITVTIGSVDILSNYHFQREWAKITDVGAKIRVDFQDFDLNIHNKNLKFMEYTHTVSNEQQELKLTLSNAYELRNVYNQMLQNVWYNSYKNAKDIQSYKKYWEDFIAKQDDMLLQGQSISADVNNIVDGIGRPVINTNGLVISKFGTNALKANADGYYVRNKGVIYGNNVTSYPDNIKFTGGEVTKTVDKVTGEEAIEVQLVDRNSLEDGFHRYYSAPIFSQRLQVLNTYENPFMPTDAVVYFWEFDYDNNNYGVLRYIKASGLSNMRTIQYTIKNSDNKDVPLYYKLIVTTVEETLPDGTTIKKSYGTIDYNTLTQIEGDISGLDNEEKLEGKLEVMMYDPLEEEIIFNVGIDEDIPKVPSFVFGGEGSNKFIIKKTEANGVLMNYTDGVSFDRRITFDDSKLTLYSANYTNAQTPLGHTNTITLGTNETSISFSNIGSASGTSTAVFKGDRASISFSKGNTSGMGTVVLEENKASISFAKSSKNKQLIVNENGIYQSRESENNTTQETKIPFTTIATEAPTNPQENDVWLKPIIS